MGSATCSSCGELWTFDVRPKGRTECFRCHVKGIRLGFTYGKQDFHGPTVRERQRQQVADAAKTGTKIEPVGTRWV